MYQHQYAEECHISISSTYWISNLWMNQNWNNDGNDMKSVIMYKHLLLLPVFRILVNKTGFVFIG